MSDDTNKSKSKINREFFYYPCPSKNNEHTYTKWISETIPIEAQGKNKI